MNQAHPDSENEYQRFRNEASKAPTGVVHDFCSFLAHNKKWWLAPILIALAVMGLLIFLGGTGAAPFIYTLF